MEFNIRKSGLAVPSPKTEPQSYPKYGKLELQEDDQRRVAREALLLLWDAMDLSSPPHFFVPGSEAYEAHYQAYRYIGKMLLGKDYPEKEVKT